MPRATQPQIGVLGRKADPQVTALAAALEQRGATAHVVDFFNFPRFNLATLRERGAATFDDVSQPAPVDLDVLDLVHLRPAVGSDLEPGGLPPLEGWAEVGEHYRRQIARLSFQLGLACALARRVPVINPPQAFLHHRTKAQQHLRLLRAGIPTPTAVVTCDAGVARRFIAAHDGQVVAKPLASGAEVVLADEAFWSGAGRALGARPFIFQRYVRGRSYRVYLLGGDVSSAGELFYDPALVDWRERTTGATPWEVPPSLAAELRRAVRLLDLPCCGVDLEWDEGTGRHYLLDLNPAALFVGWGHLLDIDAAGQLAGYLLEVADRGGEPWIS